VRVTTYIIGNAEAMKKDKKLETGAGGRRAPTSTGVVTRGGEMQGRQEKVGSKLKKDIKRKAKY